MFSSYQLKPIQSRREKHRKKYFAYHAGRQLSRVWDTGPNPTTYFKSVPNSLLSLQSSNIVGTLVNCRNYNRNRRHRRRHRHCCSWRPELSVCGCVWFPLNGPLFYCDRHHLRIEVGTHVWLLIVEVVIWSLNAEAKCLMVISGGGGGCSSIEFIAYLLLVSYLILFVFS